VLDYIRERREIHLCSPEPAPYLGDQLGMEAPVPLARTSSGYLTFNYLLPEIPVTSL